MKMVSSLLNKEWYERYKRVSRLNIHSSFYDITNECTLRCKSCLFYSSDGHKKSNEETDIKKWEEFVYNEKARGVNHAVLVGGEPALVLDRIEAFYKRIPTICTTNGLIKIPRDRFPDMIIAISLWGDEDDSKFLRGIDNLTISLNNYAGDRYAYCFYDLTPSQLGKTARVLQKIKDAGLKAHMQLVMNDDGIDGMSWTEENLKELRMEMDEMLERFPDTLISSKYYHEVITTGRMFGRTWGWYECPSISHPLDPRDPRPKRLNGFIKWRSDLKTMYPCCCTDTRDCSKCKDGTAQMAWIVVNKKEHMQSTESLQNWIEVGEMFAELNFYQVHKEDSLLTAVCCS